MGIKGSQSQGESEGLGGIAQRTAPSAQKRQTVPSPSRDSHWSRDCSGEPMSYRPKEKLVAAAQIQCSFVGTILGGKRHIV